MARPVILMYAEDGHDAERGRRVMPPAKFLIGRHPDRGLLWASVDEHVNHLEPRITEGRFAAYLAPFRFEDAARAALLATGATNIEAEERKRRGAR